MNKVMLIGNLTKDPVLRTVSTNNGDVSVCSFTIAVNRRRNRNGEEQADFFNITAWRGLGEVAAKYLAKGKKVAVSGPVSVRTYTANDGSVRGCMEIDAEDLEFLSPKEDAGAAAPSYPKGQVIQIGEGGRAMSTPQERQQAITDAINGYTPVNDDTLPF